MPKTARAMVVPFRVQGEMGGSDRQNVEVAPLQSRRRKAACDRRGGKSRIVFDASEAFLRGHRHDLPVSQQTGSRVMADTDAKDVHGRQGSLEVRWCLRRALAARRVLK